jgi:uncharacterized RDD family membrane protein YckC
MLRESDIPDTSDGVLIIETPEHVRLHFALASIGNRFLSCALDHLIQILTIILLLLIIPALSNRSFWHQNLSDAPKWLLALMSILFFILWFGYFAIFEWRMNGQTPGKRLLKLRVIREDGRPITFWEAAVRNLLRSVDMMPTFFYSIGLVSVFISSRDQRIGDIFAGTVVVREREAQAPRFDEVFASPATDEAMVRLQNPVRFTGEVRTLTDREIEVIESFLRRRTDLPDKVREWMGWRVATPVIYKIRPLIIDRETFTYEGFLEELLHRYRRVYR